jgi:hypothetical protein
MDCHPHIGNAAHQSQKSYMSDRGARDDVLARQVCARQHKECCDTPFVPEGPLIVRYAMPGKFYSETRPEGTLEPPVYPLTPVKTLLTIQSLSNRVPLPSGTKKLHAFRDPQTPVISLCWRECAAAGHPPVRNMRPAAAESVSFRIDD